METAVRDQLPENLKPLAAPLAAAARRVATERAPEILGTDAALTAWEKTNETAHKVFLKLVNGDLAPGGEVNLDVENLLTQVASGVGLPTSVVQKLPPQYQQITVLKSDQLKSSQDAVSLLKSLPWILLPLALILFAAAVWLAADTRREIVWVGGCMIFAGFVVLAARRLGSDYVVNAIADAPNIAARRQDDTLAIGTSLLTDVAWGSIALGVIIVLGGWLAGAGKWATSVRAVSAPALRDHPAATRVALGFLLVLLMIWGPVPWTRNLIWMLVLAILAFVWLEWIRRRTLEEFPDAQAGELSRRVRGVVPGRRASAALRGRFAHPPGAPGRPTRARDPRRERVPTREGGAARRLRSQRLRLERVELLLSDRAAVEQRLGLLDLRSAAAATLRGDGLDVGVELLLLAADAVGLAVGHAVVLGDEVDQRAEERQDDQEDHPQRLDPSIDVACGGRRP